MASALTLTVYGADGPRLESGLHVGEVANMFAVRAITGPYRGQTLCYRCKLGNSPVVCVFARRITAPLTSLFQQLDARIAHGNDGLKALVVFLTDDSKATATKLEALAEHCALEHVPLTLVNNRSGPQDYKIADEAEVTILMWKGPTVRVNRAYPRGGMTEADVKEVLLDLPKILKERPRSSASGLRGAGAALGAGLQTPPRAGPQVSRAHAPARGDRRSSRWPTRQTGP
jgi:hypothetical protein